LYKDVMNVVRVRKYVRDERAKAESDHVAVRAPVIDEERDLAAALKIQDAPKQWNAPRARCTTVPRWRTTRALAGYDAPTVADALGRPSIDVRAYPTNPSATLAAHPSIPRPRAWNNSMRAAKNGDGVAAACSMMVSTTLSSMFRNTADFH